MFFDRHIVKNQYTIIQSDPVYLHCFNISLLWLQNTFNSNLGLAHFPLGLGPKRANGILCGPLWLLRKCVAFFSPVISWVLNIADLPAFDALQCLFLVNLAYKSVGNFKKNPNIVQSSSIAVPALLGHIPVFELLWHCPQFLTFSM